MHPRTAARRLALASAAALAAATLVPAPAHSAPVFASFVVDNEAFAHDDGPDCTETVTATPEQNDVPVVENGPALTYTGSASGTIQHDTVPGDTVSVTSTGTVSTNATSAGGNLAKITMSATSSGTVNSALATSGCDVHAGVGAYSQLTFSNAQPGWLTVDTAASSGATYISFELEGVDIATGAFSYSSKHTSHRVLYLPAGPYAASVEIGAGVLTSVDKTFGTEASIDVSFAPAGSQTAPPFGKGKKYVTLGARSCGSDTVAAAVTGKAKRAAKLASVKFEVNGKTVVKDDKPTKGEGYVIPVAADRQALVTALIKLKPKKPGGQPRPTYTEVTYLACS